MPATRTLPTSFGHRITVFCGDHVGDKIAERGLYEPESLDVLLDLLGRIPEPVVLDVGANIGNHALAFATRAAEVHAFEPAPTLCAVLRENVRQNALVNVWVHEVALSDARGTATLQVNLTGNLGASSLEPCSGEGQPVEVRTLTGDAFVTQRGLGHVDLIKIDVEGHEDSVLRGLRQTLARDRPWLAMEWKNRRTIERLRGSPEADFLMQHYEPWVLGSTHDRLYWESRALGFLRRKCRRLLTPRRALLYPFESTRLCKNLLWVPNGREALLDPRYFTP